MCGDLDLRILTNWVSDLFVLIIHQLQHYAKVSFYLWVHFHYVFTHIMWIHYGTQKIISIESPKTIILGYINYCVPNNDETRSLFLKIIVQHSACLIVMNTKDSWAACKKVGQDFGFFLPPRHKHLKWASVCCGWCSSVLHALSQILPLWTNRVKRKGMRIRFGGKWSYGVWGGRG